MEAKHTKGEWLATDKLSVQVNPENPLKATTICQVYGGDEEHKANARLIAEAGTVANETGLTPLEMQQLAIGALDACIKCFERDKTGGYNGFGKRWEEGSPYEKAYLLYQKLNPITKTQTTQP
jgi:hypothetical protein